MRKIFNLTVNRKYSFWFSVGFITLIYLVLMSQDFFQLIPKGSYDDGLQFKLAQNIASGHWLGTYDYLTLAKGITYPVWLAIIHTIDIPLWFGNAVLYITASIAMIFALRRAITSKWALIFIYVLVLFNPLISARVYRDSIAPALCLLVLSWIIGIFLIYVTNQKNETYKRDLSIFTIIGAVSLPAWWFLREDSFWLLPTIATAALITIGFIIYSKVRKGWHISRLVSPLLLISVPFVAVIITSLIISLANQNYYGRFVVNDDVSSEFADAYGALTRVKDDNWQITVPVSENVRKKVYKVSPAFSELRSCLDNNGIGECEPFRLNNISIKNSDYEGGWFSWALRLSVQRAGYYKNPTAAQNFYIRLAREINNACDNGRLECSYGKRSSLLPPFRSEIVIPLEKNILKSALYLIELKDAEGVNASQLSNYSDDKQAMADYLNLKYNSSELNAGAKIKRHMQLLISITYSYINAILFILSVSTLFVMTIRRKRYLEYVPIIVIGWGIFATIIIRFAMLAYVDTVSFPAINVLYFGSVYPLMFVFEGLFVGLLLSYLIKKYKTKKK